MKEPLNDSTILEFLEDNIQDIILESIYISYGLSKALKERELITRWFSPRRSLALSIVMLITGALMPVYKVTKRIIASHTAPCPDLSRVQKHISQIAESAKGLKQDIEIIIVKQKNGNK